MRWFGIALLMAMLAGPAGCSRGPDDGRADMPTVVMPVFEIDPIDMPELPEWFTNGEVTIHFEPSGQYRMYRGINRHAGAVEHGRWVRVNYVSVSLQPYAVGRAAQRTRATLFRADDETQTLMLRMPGRVEPLRGLAGPPKVIEDDLFGTWHAEGATLELRRDMRFVYKQADEADGPAIRSGVAGAWHAAGEQLTLQPDAAAVSPIEFTVKTRDEAMVLEGEDRSFRRR